MRSQKSRERTVKPLMQVGKGVGKPCSAQVHERLLHPSNQDHESELGELLGDILDQSCFGPPYLTKRPSEEARACMVRHDNMVRLGAMAKALVCDEPCVDFLPASFFQIGDDKGWKAPHDAIKQLAVVILRGAVYSKSKNAQAWNKQLEALGLGTQRPTPIDTMISVLQGKGGEKVGLLVGEFWCRHFIKQVPALWGTLSLIFDHFGIVADRCDLLLFVERAWRWSLMTGSVEAVFKYLYADAFGFWTKQRERPVAPFDCPGLHLWKMFGPSLNLRLKNLQFSGSSWRAERYRFAFSVLQGKKGTAAIPFWDVERGLQKTASKLGTRREDGVDSEIDLLLRDSIYRTVREIYHQGRPVHGTTLLPSQSAHNESSRADGGACSYLLGLLHGDAGWEKPDGLPEIRRISEADLATLWSQRSVGHVEAVVHEVLEPFKLRTITTGPSVDYLIAKYVNKIVHGRLTDQRFKYTHQTVDLDSLADFLVWPGEEVASIDYEAATDNLHSDYTRWCWRVICTCLGWDDEMLQWGSKLLCDTQLSFGEVRVQQGNGQLMGNPLSFPVLCLINSACLRIVEEHEAGRQLEWRELRHRVNGDDGLMPIRPSSLNLLYRVCTGAGLIPSIGKNYLSANFGMINSQLYEFGQSFFPGLRTAIRRVPYLNCGLIKGTGRVLTDTREISGSRKGDRQGYAYDDRGGWGDLGQRARAMIQSLDPLSARAAMQAFIGWNRHLLCGTSRDWYLPVNVGGLNLPWTEEGQPPPLSTHAALVASYAASIGGLSLCKPEFRNLTSKEYRQKVPFERVQGEVDYESRDDSIWFWTDAVSTSAPPIDEERGFKKALHLAKKSGVAPCFDRSHHRWRSFPLYQIRPQQQLIPWAKNLSWYLRQRNAAHALLLEQKLGYEAYLFEVRRQRILAEYVENDLGWVTPLLLTVKV